MIYLAGPLFTTAEKDFNIRLAHEIGKRTGIPVFLPQDECGIFSQTEEIFRGCLDGINRSKLVVAILDGPDADSGTCFEAGYAYAKGIPVIGVRTDFRQRGDDGGLNLMLSKSCKELVIISSLEAGSGVEQIAEELERVIGEYKL
jgi:nucleoside 2-deoxyribosyltransferase